MLIIEHSDLRVNLKYFADYYFFSIKIPVNIVHGAVLLYFLYYSILSPRPPVLCRGNSLVFSENYAEIIPVAITYSTANVPYFHIRVHKQ